MKIQTTRARIVAFLGPFIISGIALAAGGSAVDIYHEVSVTDPYRWLENGADPKVHAWSAAQDLLARKYLDPRPLRAPIFKQLFSQLSATSSSYAGLHAIGDRVFAYYSQPPKQQPMIAALTNAADPALARVIVDPNSIGTTAIDWFEPSPDGKMLAVSMSENGSEDGTLHLFEVLSGKLPLPDVSVVDEVEPLSDGTLLYSVEIYLRPPYFRRYDPQSAQSFDTKLAQLSPVEFSDTEVVRESVKSKDGTEIPINIVRRKGTQLNGTNPLLLYGYGGFGLSETPAFLGAGTRLWLDGGGVYFRTTRFTEY